MKKKQEEKRVQKLKKKWFEAEADEGSDSEDESSINDDNEKAHFKKVKA